MRGTINLVRLRELMEEHGWSARALSLELGSSDSLVKNILSGKSQSPRGDTLGSLARTLGVSVDDLLSDEPAASGREQTAIESSATKRPARPKSVSASPRTSTVRLRSVPIVGEVRAGAWAELMDEQRTGEVQIPDLPDHDGEGIFALTLVGTSMNNHYPDGSTLICRRVPPADVRQHDHVILRRSRNGFVETTCKEVVAGEDGPVFWPRSNDPAHQEPFRVDHNEHSDEGAEVIGVVLNHVPPRRIRSGERINLTGFRKDS